MSKFTKDFIIPSTDTDYEGFIKVDKILANMALTSTLHSDALGLGVEEIRKNNYGWMLIKWELEILEYPKVDDTVKIVTWTSGFDKFYATREFEILDISGNISVKASSLWVFMDIIKRRPIRIPNDIAKKYSIIEQRNFTEFSNIEIDGDLLTKSQSFRVVENDLDENNHVNNIKYIEWLFLGLEEMQKDYIISNLAINYKKELLLGDCVHTETIQKHQVNILNHKILTSEGLNAVATSSWKKKRDF